MTYTFAYGNQLDNVLGFQTENRFTAIEIYVYLRRHYTYVGAIIATNRGSQISVEPGRSAWFGH